MPKLFFVAIALVFMVLLVQGWRSGTILGQGWWGKTRRYGRDEEPWGFYSTAFSYILALLVSLFGALYF